MQTEGQVAEEKAVNVSSLSAEKDRELQAIVAGLRAQDFVAREAAVKRFHEFYQGLSWLSWRPTRFGRVCKFLGIPSRWFPPKWTGTWRESR